MWALLPLQKVSLSSRENLLWLSFPTETHGSLSLGSGKRTLLRESLLWERKAYPDKYAYAFYKKKKKQRGRKKPTVVLKKEETTSRAIDFLSHKT